VTIAEEVAVEAETGPLPVGSSQNTLRALVEAARTPALNIITRSTATAAVIITIITAATTVVDLIVAAPTPNTTTKTVCLAGMLT
jgi:hypothetical protein